MNYLWQAITNWFQGVYQLCQSPSGIFATLCLAALTCLTLKFGAGMVMAWSAFFAIVPTALGYFEHKETLAQMNQPTQVVQVVNNLPNRGNINS